MKLAVKIAFGLALSMGSAAYAQNSASDALDNQMLLGIDKTNGNYLQYNFSAQTLNTVGQVKTSDNTVLTGLEAAAYFDGFQTMYALWNNPADSKNKLVYINVFTGAATIVKSDVEGGLFTGAVGIHDATHPYVVYALQIEKVKPPATISGLININPNNSNANEFSCTTPNGTFTRDNLKDASNLSSDGTYYQGDATLVHVKPKGNGNQNGVLLDGKEFALQNSNTYDFAGTMKVRVYNDHVNGNGKAMGKWWISITEGTVIVNNDVQVETPNRIASVNQITGEVTEIMTLSHKYHGLASTDGVMFYTHLGNDLYKIDTAAMTETKIDTMAVTEAADMEFVGSYMMTYDISTMTLGPVDHTNAHKLDTFHYYNTGKLGVTLYTPVSAMPIGPLFD
ncbi:MAG: hypothetical protein GC162_19670 [Planctomycetes bacterium]|nr:hypothetical protein [Planctomycetota bacterium]